MLTELLALAAEHDLDLVGEPRLVRLNPNIPWKTRGNAALSARFGRGAGRPRLVGEVGERQLRSFPRGRAPSPHAVERFLDAAWSVVRASAQTGEKGTDPAMVATERPFPARWYHRAVQEVVAVDQVRQELAAAGVWMRTEGSDQGLVGAAASIAWPGRPGHVGADLLPRSGAVRATARGGLAVGTRRPGRGPSTLPLLRPQDPAPPGGPAHSLPDPLRAPWNYPRCAAARPRTGPVRTRGTVGAVSDESGDRGSLDPTRGGPLARLLLGLDWGGGPRARGGLARRSRALLNRSLAGPPGGVSRLRTYEDPPPGSPGPPRRGPGASLGKPGNEA